ncbi:MULTISPECIES: TraB/GumN family protein [unclassified Novosphingobium]|uniref:TraB/GumN family protein n=1 Tax=unclassified Novosphingobium TaxID=2644732 RepID=UPI0025F039F6|nr:MULTISPECIES: TraB/GumN family protein [unclassified Novosphingobium]HQV02795.1 TraB/GumN family protein [Novosphingobium sp.]
MSNRLIAALLALLALAGCARAPEVHPALWLVEGPKGEKAWLFGTIHALPAPVEWRSAKVDAALKAADRLVLEVADITDDAKTAKAFADLAQSPGLPPLEARVQPALRDDLAEDLAAGGLKPGSLDPYETWAAALMLQNAAAAAGDNDSGNGIDRAIALAWRGPIEEFEGARAQLAIFDALPEAEQRALLDAVLIEADGREVQLRDLEQAWATGNMDLIARVTDEDFAKAPALREELLVGRNRAWLGKLEAMLAGGARPFVAVGAAHLAGRDGLPAMLAARGWKVTRLQ